MVESPMGLKPKHLFFYQQYSRNIGNLLPVQHDTEFRQFRSVRHPQVALTNNLRLLRRCGRRRPCVVHQRLNIHGPEVRRLRSDRRSDPPPVLLENPRPGPLLLLMVNPRQRRLQNDRRRPGFSQQGLDVHRPEVRGLRRGPDTGGAQQPADGNLLFCRTGDDHRRSEPGRCLGDSTVLGQIDSFERWHLGGRVGIGRRG